MLARAVDTAAGAMPMVVDSLHGPAEDGDVKICRGHPRIQLLQLRN